jgi:iron complex transport system substrate-binding protein
MRKLIVLSLIMALCVSCQKEPPVSTDRTSGEKAGKSASPYIHGSYPLRINNCGNTLIFKKTPERVVTLFPTATEIMLMLGLRQRIVGAAFTQFHSVPPNMESEFRSIKSISTKYGPSKEDLLSLRPDFVFDNEPSYFYSASNGFATQEELRSVGAQVYSLSMNCASPPPYPAVQEIYTDIRNIGKIFGTEAKAEQVIMEMQNHIEKTVGKIRGRPRLRVMVYDSGESPLNVFGGKSSRFAIFRTLGIENIFPDLVYGSVSIEEVASSKADVFVINGYSFPGIPPFEQRKEFLTRTFPDHPAVKNKRIFIVPYEYMNPGIQNITRIQELAKLLYPEAF